MRDAVKSKQTVAVLGNYSPRKCGIATFTTDLVTALSTLCNEQDCWAIAMNDKVEGYNYPDKVHFEINQKQLSDYRLAAEFLNINKPDVVCVQHEFGIFGGPAGSHVLKLLSDLRLPVVTTLHTVLTTPTEGYRAVMLRLAELSDHLIVMSQKAIDILQNVYLIDPQKITYIPHGIPDSPFVDPSYYKSQFGAAGKKMLLTFGLLSANKGIEYVLKALPEVLKHFPDVIYVVVGATHPHVVKVDGETYRLSLQQLVKQLNIEKQVVFQNRFVTQQELIEYLSAADIYITPYNDEAQITSGTLAYAMGMGKPVISTPYWYAEEMLADGRGLLVPFRSSDAISTGLLELLSDDNKRQTMRKRAYDFCREATWNSVAQQYLNVFDAVKAERNLRPKPYKQAPQLLQKSIFSQELPVMKLDHLVAMTDETGLFQHAKFTIPDRDHGYCTDDNARALIVAVEAQNLLTDSSINCEQLYNRYLSFLLHAFDPQSGRFRNFLTYDRQWLEDKTPVDSEDSHGRTLWCLGVSISQLNGARQLPMASTLFKQSLPAVENCFSPRTMAFAVIGLHAYLKIFSGDTEARRILTVLANRIFNLFSNNATQQWPWPEQQLSYDNPKLAQALILGGLTLKNTQMSDAGLQTLEWLYQIQSENGHFVPIGNHGWYLNGDEKSRFDQQPLEVHSMVDACVVAYQLNHDRQWLHRAMTAFSWFLGHNDLNLPLYDAKTGGCRDGLESNGVNENQGAESSMAWLMSLSILHSISADEVFVTDTHTDTVAIGK